MITLDWEWVKSIILLLVGGWLLYIILSHVIETYFRRKGEFIDQLNEKAKDSVDGQK